MNIHEMRQLRDVSDDDSVQQQDKDIERHREKDKHEGEKTMLRGEIVDG